MVRLAFGPGVLALAVEDDGPLVAEGAEGHGIIGMRERAVAVGGWLTAGPRGGGGFRVLAELPAPAPAGALSTIIRSPARTSSWSSASSTRTVVMTPRPT